MGKIRLKTIGDDEMEKKEKIDAEVKKEQKKARQEATEAPKEEETEEKSEEQIAGEKAKEKKEAEAEAETKAKTKKNKGPKKLGKQKVRSQKYQEALVLIDKNKLYSASDALEILEKTHLAKFDETVELHINTTASGISGALTLPHGTGKQIKVAIADDALIAEIEKGKVTFDVLIAEPSMMPKLARVAKVLGPRGLMPNPKSGTITDKPEELAKKYQSGHATFKTEAKSPIIHLSVGKLSFGKEKLAENIKSAISSVKKANITNATLKSTMSPAIKIQV